LCAPRSRKDGDFEKRVAKVLACSHQADISIITVEEDAFWEGAIELPLGETPRLQQHVDIVGFPMGGDGISVTSGVVSRVDWGLYSHGLSSNLLITVDAAINGGNSGGPAISDGKVVGVAFQGLSEGVSAPSGLACRRTLLCWVPL
jgi:S1-C subfamily serine protease